MKIILFLISLFNINEAFAVKTFNMASKCVPVEDSAVTRRIGATSGVWVRAENECERLGNIAINQNQYYSKVRTYFPGITMNFTCHKMNSSAKWRKVGCSGGLELGYLLEVTLDIENPNKYMWYHPKDLISYYNNDKNLKECLDDAQNFAWFSSNQVVAEAECRIAGDKIYRGVRVKFINY